MKKVREVRQKASRAKLRTERGELRTRAYISRRFEGHGQADA